MRLDAGELAGLDQRGDDRPVIGTTIGAGEQRVLSRQSQGADGALDGVVVDLDPAVVEEEGQALPTGQRIADRLWSAAGSVDTTLS